MFGKMSPWVISLPLKIRFWFITEDLSSRTCSSQDMNISGVLKEGRRAPTWQVKNERGKNVFKK